MSPISPIKDIHKIRMYYTIVASFLSISLLIMPVGVSADADLLTIALIAAAVIVGPEVLVPLGGAESTGVVAVQGLINTGVLSEGSLVFVGVNEAGAGLYALQTSLSAPLVFGESAAAGLLTYGSGDYTGETSNVPQAQCVAGGNCYGPINSCGESYQGTWNYSYNEDGGIVCTSCVGPDGSELTTSPPESRCAPPPPPPPPVCSFSPNPSSIIPPQTTSVSWGCQNADSCSIDQGIGSVDPSSGSRTVAPRETTTYTLSCTGRGGPADYQTTVTIKKINLREVAP